MGSKCVRKAAPQPGLNASRMRYSIDQSIERLKDEIKALKSQIKDRKAEVKQLKTEKENL